MHGLSYCCASSVREEPPSNPMCPHPLTLYISVWLPAITHKRMTLYYDIVATYSRGHSSDKLQVHADHVLVTLRSTTAADT